MAREEKSTGKVLLTALVTAGLVSGYAISVRSQWREGKKEAVLGNSLLLPASLVWLWFLQ